MPRLSANSWLVLGSAHSQSSGGRRWLYLCNGVLNNLLVRHIGLVANQQLVDALGGVAVNLLQPLLHVVERVHVGDIVDDADAVGTAIVRGCDCAEALLACGIPLQSSVSLFLRSCRLKRGAYDLKLHRLSVQLDCADFLDVC